MKFPKTIAIAGHNVKLRFVALGGCYGQYEHDRKLIAVDKEAHISSVSVLETIRHEMMEASLLLSGVGFSDKYDQEIVVRCMEEIFFPAWDRFCKRINGKK
jgi:hypothetical protein